MDEKNDGVAKNSISEETADAPERSLSAMATPLRELLNNAKLELSTEISLLIDEALPLPASEKYELDAALALASEFSCVA